MAIKELAIAPGQDIKPILTQHRVPVEIWGKGGAKTIQHLQAEVDAGETTLVADNETLLRQVGVAFIDVFYTRGEQKLKLKEEKQVFRDGRTRPRQLEGSVAEKLSRGEQPIEAARRALREELKISDAFDIQGKGSKTELKDSPSYPGLLTKFEKHYFETELNDHQYKPEGYIENQDDKTTYFTWKAT